MLRETYNAGIIAVGINIPEEIRPNSFWDNIEIDNSPKEKEKLFTGINERRIFPENLLPSDAEAVAARHAIKNSKLNYDDIDLVLCHSMMQDEVTPGNASLIQHKLGLKNAGAWNVDTCCSSFVTMLITASNLIMLGTFKNVLIVTSVIHSRMVPPTHYLSPALSGDGAAAVVVGRVSDNKGYITSACHSNGEYHNAFVMREAIKSTEDGVSPTITFYTEAEKMKKMGRNSVVDMSNIMNKTLEKAGLASSDIDFLFTHQPVHWAHEAWRDAIGVPPEKAYQTFNKYGNLASTSIPVSLYEALKAKKLKDQDTILFVSSGAGENFSSVILKWGK